MIVQNVVAATRVSHKLVLDSEQEQKREQQQQRYLEEIQKKKQQKRQKRQQAQRLQKEKQKIIQEKQKVYEKPEKMFEQDSDDGVEFKRVVKKIKRMFPQLADKFDHYGNKKKNDFIVDESDQDQSQSDSQSYDSSGNDNQESSKKIDKKKKIQRKEKKPEKRIQKKPEKKHVERNHQDAVKKEKIKLQPKTPSDKKERLVKEVSIRWWYALPEWPPVDMDYAAKLKQLGYRIVDAHQFKCQNDVINGLQKALPVEGYKGVFKTKTKIVDVRPKQTAPTLNNFRNMSIEQLTNILRKALQVQIEQLKIVQYEQQGEKQLLTQLERQLISLK